VRRRYHHFSIRSILSFFLGVGVVGVLKSGACMKLFRKKGAQKTLFLTTQKCFSSRRREERKEKSSLSRSRSRSLSLSACVCCSLALPDS
jgi:hypothetical protein